MVLIISSLNKLRFLNIFVTRHITGTTAMHCLLIAATAFEIAPFIRSYRLQAASKQPSTTDILITGVGLVACTYSIMKYLSARRPTIIIQAGVAGSFDRNLPLGTVVAVKQERIADLGVKEKDKWNTIFDLDLARPGRPPYSKGWLVNKSPVLKKISLLKVSGNSVNEITTSPQRIKTYRQQFQPVTESLEGAGLHHVALSENIPFLQLRSLSNYVGEREKKKWRFAESIHNLNLELIKTINMLNTGS